MPLLPDFHCLAPDLPEQGRSVGIAPFDLHDAAQRAADVIAERVPSGRAHVVGLSLGGAVALTMLRLSPERIDHVVLSGASSGLDKLLSGLMAATGFLYALVPELMIDMALRQFDVPSEYHDVCREDMRISVTPDFNGRMVDALANVVLPLATASPVLALVGEKETLQAKQAARDIAATVPGARAMLVPGAGHVWNLEAPDLFAVTVRAWVSDGPLPRELRSLG